MAKRMRKRDTSAGTTRKQTTSSKSRDPVRLQLIQQVQSGAMTPEEAEAEAERLGIAPLIAQPDPAQFDPMNEVAWTLPMVAAWITFKSLDDVREWWTPYRSEIRYWRLLEEGGREWELASPPPATLPLMFLSNVPISLDRVVREIKTAGRAGRIRATGTCTRTNERREIQAIEWQDLECVEAGERDALRFIRRIKTTSSHGYDDILFGRDEILKEWPLTDGDSTRLTREPEAAKKRRAGRRLGSTDFDWGRRKMFCLPIARNNTAILPMTRIGLMAGKTKPMLERAG